MSTTTISDLPDLPMTKIFSYLPMVDRLRAELVCRRWNQLAKDKDSWRHFHALRNEDLGELLNKKRSTKLQLKRLISRFGEFVNELEFECLGSPLYHPECLHLDLLPLIVQQIGGHGICHLKIEFWKSRGHNDELVNENYLVMIQIANKMPELRTLVIRGKIEHFDLEWLKMFGDHCSKLELFHLHWLPSELAPVLDRSGFVFPASLKNIKFYMGDERPRDNNNQIYLSKITNECPNLVSFDGNLSTLDAYSAKELATRVHHMTCKSTLILAMERQQCFENIRALEFFRLDPKEFVLIGQKCSQLEHLNVYKFKTSNADPRWVEDIIDTAKRFATEIAAKIDELGAAFSNLKSLEVSNKNVIQFVLPLVKNGNFNQLEWINLPRDYLYVTEDITAVMENCPKLNYLAADSLSIEAICEIVRRRKDCQLQQLRMNRTIWPRDLAQICDVLVNFYDEKEIPNNVDNPGIVRISCFNGPTPNTPQWTFDSDLHPWLRIFDNYKKRWPSSTALDQARYGELSEIPLFLDCGVGN